ncbi:hypothetical protein [Curtobacterium sp. MCJR17_043]|uniref:hypothetical protein n=1 Tax=Curtobacterium sp. MCJR17_043 TaxID=2175660 RepID=UPI0024E00594|nr:hypothetical protein [Curtobacterium sp. MCJR17_043]WIB37211.1 hypothetical protein DEJ15_17125 [Curtobacterium sp. MCJR17_043]
MSPPSKRDVPPASKFSWITVAAPLVLAGAMVALLGDARFALFALLSPVTAIGMWFEQKHRRAKNLKEEDERFAEAVRDFSGEITAAAAIEAARRQELVPDPATVVRRALLPATTLWQRRADDVDFLSLHAGTGDAPWRPQLDSRATQMKLEEAAKTAIEESKLTAAPVVADLSDAGVVGIVGDREGALALARSLLVQATVHCGPADLTVGVFCDRGREDDWSWASWLPHTRVAGSSTGQRWMSAQRDQGAAVLRGLRESIDELPTPELLVLIDSEVLTEGRDAPARSLLGHGRAALGQVRRPGERPRRVSGIVIATNEQQLPAACTTIITVGGRRGRDGVPPGGPHARRRRRARRSQPGGRRAVRPARLALRRPGTPGAGCLAAVARAAARPARERRPPTLLPSRAVPRPSVPPGRPGPASRRRSGRRRAASSRSTWSATAHTAWSVGRRVPARASSYAPSSPGSPRATTRRA